MSRRFMSELQRLKGPPPLGDAEAGWFWWKPDLCDPVLDLDRRDGRDEVENPR